MSTDNRLIQAHKMRAVTTTRGRFWKVMYFFTGALLKFQRILI